MVFSAVVSGDNGHWLLLEMLEFGPGVLQCYSGLVAEINGQIVSPGHGVWVAERAHQDYFFKQSRQDFLIQGEAWK